jgi:hypothetical protein
MNGYQRLADFRPESVLDPIADLVCGCDAHGARHEQVESMNIMRLGRARRMRLSRRARYWCALGRSARRLACSTERRCPPPAQRRRRGRTAPECPNGKSRNRRCSPLYREFYEQVRRLKCDIERSFRDPDAIEAGAAEETAQFSCVRQRKGDIDRGHRHVQMARRRLKQRLVGRMATERLPYADHDAAALRQKPPHLLAAAAPVGKELKSLLAEDEIECLIRHIEFDRGPCEPLDRCTRRSGNCPAHGKMARLMSTATTRPSEPTIGATWRATLSVPAARSRTLSPRRGAAYSSSTRVNGSAMARPR